MPRVTTSVTRSTRSRALCSPRLLPSKCARQFSSNQSRSASRLSDSAANSSWLKAINYGTRQYPRRPHVSAHRTTRTRLSKLPDGLFHLLLDRSISSGWWTAMTSWAASNCPCKRTKRPRLCLLTVNRLAHDFPVRYRLLVIGGQFKVGTHHAIDVWTRKIEMILICERAFT
jgi:hypothetical protein